MSRYIPPAWPGQSSAPGGTRAVPCRRCGHDLRGLTERDACPHCRAAVGFTTHGELLRFADPAWTRALCRGVRLVIASVAVLVVAFLVNMVTVVFDPKSRWPAIVLGVAALVSYPVWLRGAWLLTRRDPSGAGEPRYGRSRRIARAGLTAGAVGLLATVPGPALAEAPAALLVLREALIGLAAVAAAAGIVALLDYLRKLVRRLRDPRLTARADFLFYALGTSYACTAALQLGVRYAVLFRAVPIAEVLALFSGLTSLATLVFGAIFLRMLERTGKRIAEEATAAEETWARPRPAPAHPC